MTPGADSGERNRADSGERNPSATLIIGQEVKVGSEGEFGAWLNASHASAAGAPGCIGTEDARPAGIQQEWTSIYRFDSLANLLAWMKSAERQELLDRVGALIVRPATQQILSDESAVHQDHVATVVVTHRVEPGTEDEFQAWTVRMTEAEKQFAGFRGAELFKPIPGVQEEWIAIYRFDSAAQLDVWLASAERAELLAQGDKFQDFDLRTLESSFGSWFTVDETPGRQPGDLTMSIAIWLGLYPTVVLLTLALRKLFPNAELWQMLLIGNLASSFAMTYVTMPYYVNPALRFWLKPDNNAPQPMTNIKGAAFTFAMLAAWTVVFWLTTSLFWTLP